MAHKKRILFALPGLHVGGIEKHLLKQLAHFNREKYELHLLTFFYIAGSPDLFAQVPPYVHVHRFAFSIGIDIKNTWRLLQFLRNLRPDLVVSSMVFPNTIMRLLKPLVGYKVIAREHNTYTDKTFRHKFRDHVCAHLSDAIVAVSPMVADYAAAQARIPRAAFTVIQNGVDLEDITQYQKTSAEKVHKLYEEFSLPPGTKIVLNVARLKPQKNHTLLIEAFARFVEHHPDYVLFMLGTGADQDTIRLKIKEMGLEGKVIMAGYREDVYTFYAASDFFILTSDIEGFPNVAVEAMAFGLPVLSTLVAGIDELVEPGVNGFLLERNTSAVVETLSRFVALDIGARTQMRVQCEKTAHRYAIVKNVVRYEELFDGLLQNGRN